MKNFLSILIIISTLSFVSCKKDSAAPEPDPTAGLVKQAEGFAAGAATKIVLYTKETTITSSYTRFYIALYDSVTGSRVEDAHIHLMPMMDMGTMQHSAPAENPASEEAVNHLFPCSVVFIMSSMGGSWTLNVDVHNHATGKEGTLSIPVNVAEPAKARVKSFVALHNAAKYFVAYIGPAAPKVGINDMEIAVYKRAGMMSFPADSSLSVVLTPEMPSMGHGSPNNVNPIHQSKGHYKGKVNFTMTGDWRLHLDFNAGSAVADSSQYFDLVF